jgi:DNA-binding transcriptional LysR family regulator
MELRHLRYFVAVAEELHFRRAAERLHVVQPAVSQQLRKLEDELGVQLLERTPQSVSLTDAGAVMLDQAREILQRVEEAREAVCRARDRANRLRVGYLPASLPVSVQVTLGRLAASVPNFNAALVPGAGLELVEAVEMGSLDVAIISLPAPIASLRVTPLGGQRPIAAVPIGHAHAVRSKIDLQRLVPERVVVLPRESDRAFYDAVLTSCRESGLAPTLMELEDSSIERALLAIATGAGVGLLPDSVADRYLPAGSRFIPLDGTPAEVQTAALTRHGTTHMPTAAFLRALSRMATRRRPPSGNTADGAVAWSRDLTAQPAG